ncbi:hypothetical protein F5Y16DRAFT_31096 [Xylariaceae sp. FL0255]|nr:hypothetical protein F5Y16DRAFT_31096 [Xylariaceae sp. FL0255]
MQDQFINVLRCLVCPIQLPTLPSIFLTSTLTDNMTTDAQLPNTNEPWSLSSPLRQLDPISCSLDAQEHPTTVLGVEYDLCWNNDVPSTINTSFTPIMDDGTCISPLILGGSTEIRPSPPVPPVQPTSPPISAAVPYLNTNPFLADLSSESAPTTVYPNPLTSPKSATSSNDNSDEAGKRHRNRLAAAKCRRLQKAHQGKIERKVKALSEENAAMKIQQRLLRHEVLVLKEEVLRHHNCYSPAIQMFIGSMACRLSAPERIRDVDAGENRLQEI